MEPADMKPVSAKVPPELLRLFDECIARRLGTRQDHVAVALLMYLAAADEIRRDLQNIYETFRRTGGFELPELTSLLPADEAELLTAYRAATPKARDEAVVNLEDQQAGRNVDNGERCDRAG